MDLEKMIGMQRELDDYINEVHPLTKGEDRFADKVLALVVECSEMANEARFFKFWSKDRTPRKTCKCNTCSGSGNMYEIGDCRSCGGSGYTDRLLEEYVDGIHFFLSLAIEKGWENALHLHKDTLHELRETGLDGGLTGALNETIYLLMKSYIEIHPGDVEFSGYQANEFYFRLAWGNFTALGIVGFGFTEKQIESAYTKKHAENVRRQEVGY